MARDYKKEYAASRTPKRRAANIKRKRDRRAHERKNGKIPNGMELDHVTPLAKNGKSSKTRVVPKTTNRKKQPKRKT